MLIDRKGRRYLVRLEPGQDFHTHVGTVAHDDIIGSPEGSHFRPSKGGDVVVFRPSLADYILKMPRGAQVIYPKDLGPILTLADVAPGLRILESGVGSGALSMALLRAGASVTGYEIREDFAGRARNNVEDFLGSDALENYDVQIRDCYEGIDDQDLDRVLLDLPEPWRVVPHAADSLRCGGTFLAYTPSVTQVMQLRGALDAAGFEMAETVEVLNRTWHVDGASVRPDHRMVAHTGFLTHARLGAGPIAAGTPAPD
jgi:tRNA (adenine57-N1/adenine58-N1)-methyltransferase